MYIPQLIDLDSDGTTTKVAKETQEMGEHPTKTIFINIFLGQGHNGSIHDCEITFIDKTDTSNPTNREFFWMRLLKTIAPLGLIIHIFVYTYIYNIYII